MENGDLFALTGTQAPVIEQFSQGAWHLRGFIIDHAKPILAEIEAVAAISPFRHLQTPGGGIMSVAMTNCGGLGWVSDSKGYRYQSNDPLSNQPWPSIPTTLLELAQTAALASGFNDFQPQACLINRYAISAKMGLHQDKDERNLTAPIVSMSLGLPALFQWGGLNRQDKHEKRLLEHGDVVVWGGPDRLRFHGVQTIKAAHHPLTGGHRFNITFRQVR